MFVERLTKKQIIDFLNSQKDYENVIDIANYKEQNMWIEGLIQFHVTFTKAPTSRVSTFLRATDKEIYLSYLQNSSIDKQWKQFLYQIFGDEYKLWYKKQQQKEFLEIFGS